MRAQHMMVGAAAATALPAWSEACDIPRKDWETLVIPFGFEEQIAAITDRMQRELSKGKMSHIAQVPSGFPWWAEYSHTTSLPRVPRGPCHVGSQLWKIWGRAASVSQCLPVTLAGSSPWDAPFPEWRAGPGCLLMKGPALSSRDGAAFIPQFQAGQAWFHWSKDPQPYLHDRGRHL